MEFGIFNSLYCPKQAVEAGRLGLEVRSTITCRLDCGFPTTGAPSRSASAAAPLE